MNKLRFVKHFTFLINYKAGSISYVISALLIKKPRSNRWREVSLSACTCAGYSFSGGAQAFDQLIQRL